MSTRRGNPGAAACGRHIYVFGGYDSEDHVTTTAERLRVGRLRGRRWRAIEALPEQTSGPGVATLGGQIYIVGGADSDGSLMRIYDPRRDSYVDAPPMPTARYNLKATVLGGLLYAIGGISGDDDTFLRTVERYNPKTQTWQTVAPMNEGRGNPGVVTARGRIYVFGGATKTPESDVSASDTAEVYDPERNSWTKLGAKLPVGRGSLCGERRRGKMLAIGGFELPNPPFSASARVEVLKL
jgi:N-acetylneuraminic acid mutarotase